MSVSINFDNSELISSKEAGRLFGYTSDYVSRLARQGKVTSSRVGNQWFVDPRSLRAFLDGIISKEEVRRHDLSEQRKIERQFFETVTIDEKAIHDEFTVAGLSSSSLLKIISSALVGVAVIILAFFFSSVDSLKSDAIAKNILDKAARDFDTLAGYFSTGSYSATGDELAPAASTSRVQRSKEGIVIVPEGKTQDETLRSIAESFSDEVDVELASDGRTGIIRPIFSKDPGEEYRFVIVPVHTP